MPDNSVTFTISAASAEELAVLMRRIARAIESVDDFALNGEAGADSESTLDDETTWYRLNATRFLDKLKADARQALLYIAHRAPAPTTVNEVATELGVEAGPRLAGRLASVGWAARVLKAPAPPYERSRDLYEMNIDVAAAFISAAGDKRAQ